MPKGGNGGGGNPGGNGGATFAVLGLDGSGDLIQGTGDPLLEDGVPTRVINVEVTDGTTTWTGDATWIEQPDGTWMWQVSLAGMEAGSGDFLDDEVGSFSVTASYTETNPKNNREKTTTTEAQTITLEGPSNAAPVADDEAVATDEDTTLANIDVLTGDTDPDGDALSVSDATVVSGLGSVMVNADNTLTYTPAPNDNGEVVIEYTVIDGNGGSDTGTVTVTVNPVNDAPVATDDTATTVEDTPVDIDVLGDDTDVDDGDILSVSGATVTSGGGSVVVNADNTLTYTPAENASGDVVIEYTVIDGNGGSDVGQVTVTVSAVNDAPVAVTSFETIDENTSADFDALANDTDAENDSLTVTSASALNGTVTINADGTLHYVPDANFAGADTITYTIEDGQGGSDTGTVEVTVVEGNDIPTVSNTSVVTDEDTPIVIDLLAQGSDPESNPLQVIIDEENTTGEGLLTINPDDPSTYLFIPEDDWSGTATFNFTVWDGTIIDGQAIAADWATATITVNPVNDAPIAVADNGSTTAFQTAVLIDVLSNDTDVDNDVSELTLVSVTGDPAFGTFEVSGNQVLFTPAADFEGLATFSYVVSDGDLTDDTGTGSVTVEPNIDIVPPFVSAPDLATVSDSGDPAFAGSDTDNRTNNTTPTFIGTAEAGATVELWDGGTLLDSTVADAGGTWELTVNLSAGTHQISARAVDAAGNWSEYTAALEVVIDVSTDTPVITMVLMADGAPNISGTTNDPTPTVQGNAEAFSLVEIYADGAKLGETRASDTGFWSFTVPLAAALADGSYSLTAESSDIAGNAIAVSQPFSIIVDAPEGPIDPEGPPLASFTPDDDLYAEQWNLQAIGNIEAIWGEFTGRNVLVGIYDDGIEYTHSDLDDNYDTAGHLIWNGTTLDPSPPQPPAEDDNSVAKHGTAVAGLIGAEANGSGTVGIAFDATLSGVNIFSGPADVNEAIYEYLDGATDPAAEGFEWAIRQMSNWDVINHSWGGTPTYSNDLSDPAAVTYGVSLAFYEALVDATSYGRNLLGSNVVKSAGNLADNANANFYDTNRYTITVAAYDSDLDASWYSNRGANILISAPGSGNTIKDADGNLTAESDLRIATTDRAGTFGYSETDWSSPYDVSGFGGTSAAAPTVAGVIALMLEANPNLGWRDVQTILAYSAREIGSPTGTQGTLTEEVPVDLDDDFTFESRGIMPVEYFAGVWNGANDWNGGGLHWSMDYGYGSVDVFNAVRMAEIWSFFDAPQTSWNEVSATTGLLTPTGMLTSGNGDTVSWSYVHSGAAMDLEYVDITIALAGAFLGEAQLLVTSPSGTTVTLMDLSINDYTPAYVQVDPAIWTPLHGMLGFTPLYNVVLDWTFGANGFRGEDPNGEWTFTLSEINDPWDETTWNGYEHDGLELREVTLDFFGAAGDADDRYTYTDEIVTLGLHADADRRVLDDAGGTDWINMAAVSYDVALDLSAGASSTAGGVAVLELGPGTVIENAVTGDGNDVIQGNGENNILAGMRGNDTVLGGSGDDTIIGHQGDDELWGEIGADTFWFGTWDGNDAIMDFEDNLDLISLDVEGVLGLADLTFNDVGSDQVIGLTTGDTITVAGAAGWNLTDDIDFSGLAVTL